MLRSITEPVAVTWNLCRIGLCSMRHYGTNPIEYRTRAELMRSASGVGLGRGGKGKKKGTSKTALRKFRPFKFGEGKGGQLWCGLSYPLDRIESTVTNPKWMSKNMGLMKNVPEQQFIQNRVTFPALEGGFMDKRGISELYWSRTGWTSASMKGAYVGCPELPDGTAMTDFLSFVLEVKRVTNMTRAGRKKTVSALVVLGNKKGTVGFAVGKAELPKAAIRKAKNKAIHHLQYVPRYQDHTVYHNIKVKYCRTTVLFERKVRGSGLNCHRIINLICRLAGIADAYAKIIGSTNPLNIVRATMDGLTSQETHQDLADKSKKFVVEFSRECDFRPVVVAVPKSKDSPELTAKLKTMKLL